MVSAAATARRAPVVRLGQNFLADANLLEAIVRDAELDPHDVALEVGGGEGALTDRLAPRVAHLHVIELDRRLAGDLGATSARHPNLSVVWGDAMRVDLAGASAVAHRGGLEPALLDRHPGAAADGRRAAGGRRVDGDGATRDRRPPAGGPGLADLWGAQRARPACLRRRAAAHGGSRRVHAPGRGWTRRSCGSPGAARRRRRASPGSCATRSPTAESRMAGSLELAGGPSREAVRTALGDLGLDERRSGRGARACRLRPASRSVWGSV